MSDHSEIIYEVTLCVDPEIIDEFDEWLVDHVGEMLELPGFNDAHIYRLDDDEEGHARRVAHYHMQGQAELDDYLAGPALEMRHSGIDRFGDRFSASRRVLSPTGTGQAITAEMRDCLNCGATLSGQYCGTCGQRAKSRMISVWELTRDAFGDLFELDSRLWSSLLPLLVRPGQLTRDYLEGRRARYMPPFRTYLVLSILFFLVAFFNPREDFGIFFAQEAPPTAEEMAEEEAAQAEKMAELREDIITDLEEEGIFEEHPELAEHLNIDADSEDDESPGINLKLSGDEDDSSGLTITVDDDDEDGGVCENGDLEDADLPFWLAERLTPDRLQAMCDKILADEGKSLFEKLLENIPAGLIFLLPLMALALKMLYPLSKRYYVEHLLFFVHFHAFFFLILILMITFARMATKTPMPTALANFILVASSFYIPIYLYKAMRRVYSQRHWLTIPKYIVLVFVYVVGFAMMFATAFLLAAFSI